MQAYQLGEVVRFGTDEDAEAALRGMVNLLQQAAIPRPPIAPGVERRGQHGCKEGVLRALQYGLLSSGPRAVPSLLRLLQATDYTVGASVNVAKRIAHALGEAAESPTLEQVIALVSCHRNVSAQIEAYVAKLEQSGVHFVDIWNADISDLQAADRTLREFGGAGVIQREPDDMYGAELHLLAATTIQALGVVAERIAACNCKDNANVDSELVRAVANGLADCIATAEPGWMFEARQGCAARECAAQGMLKLASGLGVPCPSSWVVNPIANAGQTHATCVPGLVLEARRRAELYGGRGVVALAVVDAIDRLVANINHVDAAGVVWAEGETMYNIRS